MLHPSEVCVARGRHAVLPTYVFLQRFAAPVLKIEGWVCQYKIELFILVLVGTEGVGVVAQVSLDAANTEVHLCELPRGRVTFLAKDGDVLYHVAAMVLDEGGGLHEHASATTAGVVHTTVERLEDFHQRAHDARRCIEFTGVFALH